MTASISPRPAAPARGTRRPARQVARLVARLGVALAAVGLLLGAVDLPASASVTARATFVPATGPVFGNPNAQQNAIISRLLDNIAHTPSGATIRIVGYSWSLGNVATALLKAHSRGVNVRVVVNGHSKQWSPAKRLVAAIGTDPTAKSFIVLTKGSARGTSGVTHQKTWSFSRVGGTPYVTMVGSTNLTGYGTTVQWSDMYTYTGRQDVFDVYTHMFALQKLDTPVTNPYWLGTFANGNASFYPRPGTTASTDPVKERIDALPDGPSTVIRVSQFAWYGDRGGWLAKALAAKAATGATITVVAGQSVGKNVRTTLKAADIPVYTGMYPHGKRIHTKLMLASYVVDGVRHNSIWTGSDNWAKQSFLNDDVDLQVDDDDAGYAKYVSFFTTLTQESGKPPVGGTPSTLAAAAKQRTVASNHLSRHRVRSGRGKVWMHGTVRPTYAGRTVYVQRRRVGTKTWTTVAHTAPLTTKAYRLRVPSRARGTWRYRAHVRATATATAATPGSVRLRVTR